MYRSTAQDSSRPATVMGAVVSGFASFLRLQGAEAEDIFERSAINPDVLGDPNQPISLPAFLKAVDTAATLTENDNFGLWLGNQYRPEYLGLWGYVGLSSATLGDALLNMSRFFPEFQSRSFFKVNHFQGKVRLEYGLLDSTIISRRHDAEMTLGNVFNVMRRALGERWAPLEVHFSHARPECWQDHQKAFRTDVRFEQSSNAIILNASDLSRAMPGADPQLLLIAQQSFGVLRVAGSVRLTTAERVRSEIIDSIPGGVPRIEQVADRLGIPVWTLTRQLKDEGQTFSGLFDSVRKEMAYYYLEKTAINISKLAELLGYTETSSFTHAFNRWTGESPKRWRDQARYAESLGE
ncbi:MULTISPECIES: AraC family transcriptional regulator [Pseudomonas]|uniref:HTH araC/xylS-type domain-containing protein n=1 Tax=Pseudomonas putida TaxID=303 RepID=A0A2S3XCH6_PSEPU|nr:MULTISPECIES: AraC family transcriptional regulator [Pseudomonas]AVD83797.1 AraC family transcriptional regulator [Pseudomonas sp. SWI6]AVD95033.1 AraC family transcriptional regulator [Pseudomonas sp. SWI36]ELU0814725.1 AraC family transcriptional regulator [Pseudomonas putida]MBH3388260.1 AraC family transcriptional regulator [Pseudomonas putida]MCK2121401.1 AraC family transcriptional regulator [Pseudomonas sp. PNPG3]